MSTAASARPVPAPTAQPVLPPPAAQPAAQPPAGAVAGGSTGIIKVTGKWRGQEVLDANRKHLEPHELRAVFKELAPDPFWAGYFKLQYYYGCRVSEVALVLKEDVNWAEKQILIRRLKKRSGDGFSEQVYSMSDRLLLALRDVWRAAPLENPWLFGSSRMRHSPDKAGTNRLALLRKLDGGHTAVSRSAADIRFRAAALKAGIPRGLAHTHSLRHTRATLMLAAGASEEDVKFLLGHSTVNVTRRYLGAAQSLRLRAEQKAGLGVGDLI